MKESYYFSHDSNASDDPKCLLLIDQLGLEGYGIYWVLIEQLRNQPDFKYPIQLLAPLAKRYSTSGEKFAAVVKNYGLFQIDEDYFFSLSLNNRMGKYIETKEKRRLAANARWKNNDANAMQVHNISNANAMQMQSTCNANKVKESKVNKNKEEGEEAFSKPAPKKFIKPELIEVEEFFFQKNFAAEGAKFYNYFESNGWMVGRNKMKDWHAAANNWISRVDNFKSNTNGKHKPSVTDLLRTY